jgi:hypothetical protein
MADKNGDKERSFEINIVGPCYPSYGDFGDDRQRHELVVEVRVEEGRTLSSTSFTYGLRTTADLDFPDAMRFLRWGASHSRLIYTQDELVGEWHRLAKFNRFMEKLPVRPNDLAELLATVLAFEKASTVRLIVYKDHRSKPEILEDGTTSTRACYVLAQRLQGLGKKEAPEVVG